MAWKNAYVWVAASGYGTEDVDEVDDDDPTTTREDFNTDQWYCIEMHWRTHTAGNADGLYEAWINGEKVFRGYGVGG